MDTTYYLPYESDLHNEFRDEDIIEIRILRKGKSIYEKRYTSVIKLEDYKTNDCVKYIHDSVKRLDKFLSASPRGVSLLRKAAMEYSETKDLDTTTEFKSSNYGLFGTFLAKIPKMINFHEKESVHFFALRFARIFDGVGNIMSAMVLTEDGILNSLPKDDTFSMNLIRTQFNKALEDRLHKPTISLPTKKCVCNVVEFENPCVLKGDQLFVHGQVVKECDSFYSIYHLSEKYLKTIIRLGCTGDHNERCIFIYYHPNVNNDRIMNITLLLDTKLSSVFKKFSLGVTCVSLYKSQTECAIDLLPLVHGFPHLDIHLFSGFRQKLLNLVKNVAVITSEVSLSVGNFISNWMIENKIYQGSGDRIQYLMQPYFSSLLFTELFQVGDPDYSRLEFIECPEVLRFSSQMYKKIKQCLEGLSRNYKVADPILPIEKDGQILLGCGTLVNPIDLFHHPCFVTNLSIGRNNNIEFKSWNPEIRKPYIFRRHFQLKENDHRRSYCRVCTREFPNVQFALLCGIRCTFVYREYIKRIERSIEKLPPEYEFMSNAIVSDDWSARFSSITGLHSVLKVNYSNLIAGILTTEIPYRKVTEMDLETGYRKDVVHAIDSRGIFTEIM